MEFNIKVSSTTKAAGAGKVFRSGPMAQFMKVTGKTVSKTEEVD